MLVSLAISVLLILSGSLWFFLVLPGSLWFSLVLFGSRRFSLVLSVKEGRHRAASAREHRRLQRVRRVILLAAAAHIYKALCALSSATEAPPLQGLSLARGAPRDPKV